MGFSVNSGVEPVVFIPDWTDKPLWEKKFIAWKSLLQKSCPAKAGMRGHFCAWGGHACYYNACPRRIFEEVAVIADAISRPVPSPKFEKQFKENVKKMNQMEKTLGAAMKEIKTLKKELKKEA